MNRRNYLKGLAAVAAATTVPVSLAFGDVSHYEIFHAAEAPGAIRVIKAGSKVSQYYHKSELYNFERGITGKNFSPALNKAFERDPETCLWLVRDDLTSGKVSSIVYSTKSDNPTECMYEFRRYTTYGNEFDV